MNTPVVSVIVPCYNYGKFMHDTLNSLLNQSLKEWECILIDSSSSDNTVDVAQHYCKMDNRFSLFSKSNEGPSAARNLGLKRSRGLYIQFLDGDDLIEEEKLSVHARALSEDNALDIVYGDVRYFANDISEREKKIEDLSELHKPKISGKGNKMIHAFMRQNIFVINAPLTRKSSLIKSGFFDERLQTLEDYDLWWRCALLGMQFRYSVQPGTLALVRSHHQSYSRNSVLMKMSVLPVLLKNISIFKMSFASLIYLTARFEMHLLDSIIEKDRKIILSALLKFTDTPWRKIYLVFMYLLLVPLLPFLLLLKLFFILRGKK
jgi:glycosyltransferase involved in cell wall biosynthesis